MQFRRQQHDYIRNERPWDRRSPERQISGKGPMRRDAFLSDRHHLDMMVVPLFLPFWGTAFPGILNQAQ